MIKKIIYGVVGAFLLFNVFIYGNIIAFRAIAPSDTAFMRSRMKQLAVQKPHIKLNYQWVNYNLISDNLKKAVIASEDAHFAEHYGFDWRGIQEALKKNQQHGVVKSGGSTISQQLAKNLFLNEGRSYWRKAEEAIITAMLESSTSKDRIYALYLNIIEWDYGVYGAQAAAQHFYGIPATQLNATQSAQMAARISAPLHYADHPQDAKLRRKTNVILRRMKSATLPE